MKDLKNIVVLGGGLAGLTAAYWCRRQNPDRPVMVLEKAEQAVSWLRQRGEDRLVMGTAMDAPESFEDSYPRGGHVSGPVLTRWPGKANLEWLRSLGLAVGVEEGGARWLASPRALAEVLLDAVRSMGIEVGTGFAVEALSAQPSGGFRIWSREGEQIEAGRILLATGAEHRHGLRLFEELTHLKARSVLPAYLRLKPSNKRMATRLGCLEREVRLIAGETGVPTRGWMAVSARGIEGPAVSRLTAQHAEAWKQQGYEGHVAVDWVPTMKEGQVLAELASRVETSRRKAIGEEGLFGFNERQWQVFLEMAKIEASCPWSRVKTRQLQTLVHRLKAYRFAFKGMGLPSGERALAGGVLLEDLDGEACRVQGVEGVYVAGEIIDWLGAPGGPHLDLMWASAHLAGSALALDS